MDDLKEWAEDGHMFSDYQHIYPVNDLREHEISASCWCNSKWDMDGLIIHNAMDGRESYEQGRKMQ